jgi:hypothetical protein
VEIDRNSARVRTNPDGAVVVILLLTGDDPPVWKRYFNEAARGASLLAVAVDTVAPWTIVATFPASVDERELRKGLSSVQKCVEAANYPRGPHGSNLSAINQWLQNWGAGNPAISYPEPGTEP